MKRLLAFALCCVVVAGCRQIGCHETVEFIGPKDYVRECDLGARLVTETVAGDRPLLVRCVCGTTDGGR